MKEGSHPRSGVVCPGCGSAERHRMLLRYLMENEQTFFKRGARVLYIAPMKGIKDYFQQLEHVEYLGADLESSLADVHFDLQEIPYPDASFDFCICSHTLAHVKNDIVALEELHRVISKDGKLIVLERIHEDTKTVDLDQNLNDEERLNHYDQVDRWRKYGPDLKVRIEQIGFSVEVIPYGQSLPDELIKKEVIDMSEDLFLCTRL